MPHVLTGLNSVQLLGRVGQDPKVAGSTRKVVQFSMATTVYYQPTGNTGYVSSGKVNLLLPISNSFCVYNLLLCHQALFCIEGEHGDKWSFEFRKGAVNLLV